jgi:DNA-binding HxlR family transcriptional regulator
MEKAKMESMKSITKILCDKRLAAIKSYLEKDHAVDCLFLLYLDKGRWGTARRFMRDKLKKHIADGTFRLRMMELEMLGLATYKNIDNNPNKKHYLITDFGKKVNESLIQLFHEVHGGDV